MESIGPTKAKIFSISSLTGKVCQCLPFITGEMATQLKTLKIIKEHLSHQWVNAWEYFP